jgi:hypothetical protein
MQQTAVDPPSEAPKAKKKKQNAAKRISAWFEKRIRKALGRGGEDGNGDQRGELVSSRWSLGSMTAVWIATLVLMVFHALELTYGPSTTTWSSLAYLIFLAIVGGVGLFGWISTFCFLRAHPTGTDPDLVQHALNGMTKEGMLVRQMRMWFFTVVAIFQGTDALMSGYYYSHYNNMAPQKFDDPIQVRTRGVECHGG